MGWVGSRGIMEQRVLIGAEQKIATRALLVTGIYDRRARKFLGMPKMMETIGVVARPRRRSVRPPKRCWPPTQR